jgi:hypothetical protein
MKKFKKKIVKQIKKTIFYGRVIPMETKRFDDSELFGPDNMFENKLSKVNIFLGKNKDNKEIILGIQTFYLNISGEIIERIQAKDENQNNFVIKSLEIPSNDYITNFYLGVKNDIIVQIELITKRGRKLVVGNEECERRKEPLNDSHDNMVLYFYGGYRKSLEALSVGYIPTLSYYKYLSMGYFMLNKKLKDPKFKDQVLANFEKLEENDKILFRVCCLPDACFNSIVKFCFVLIFDDGYNNI